MKIEKYIRYMAYSGRVVTTTLTVDSEMTDDEVIDLSYKEKSGPYSSDNIHKILDIE